MCGHISSIEVKTWATGPTTITCKIISSLHNFLAISLTSSQSFHSGMQHILLQLTIFLQLSFHNFASSSTWLLPVCKHERKRPKDLVTSCNSYHVTSSRRNVADHYISNTVGQSWEYGTVSSLVRIETSSWSLNKDKVKILCLSLICLPSVYLILHVMPSTYLHYTGTLPRQNSTQS